MGGSEKEGVRSVREGESEGVSVSFLPVIISDLSS